MLVADTLVTIGLATLSLGTIHEADGPQEHTFWLRNEGTEAVTLMQGYTSCGCTTIAFSRGASVAPADSTRVTLRFNPRGKGGEFLETGTVVYGPRRKRVQLSLAGNCITSEETLMRQFPIRIGDSLRLSARRFDLGRLSVGERRERTVVVLHRADGDRQEQIVVPFVATEQHAKGLQHIATPITVGGRKVDIVFDVFIR